MAENTNAKRMLVVLPTYNEGSNIAKMVEAIRDLHIGASILIIDDSSPDGTGRIADELANANKDVFVIHRERKLGLGSAYVEGFKFGLKNKFDYICEMDADFSHDPKYLIDFCRELKNCDLVIASRYMNGISIVNWGMLRLLLSFFANKFVKFITGMPFSDCMGGFKCFRAEVIRDIDPDNIVSKGYVFQMEMLYRAYEKGCRIREWPIIFYNRKHGRSKMDRKEILESFFVVIYLRLLLGFHRVFRKRRT